MSARCPWRSACSGTRRMLRCPPTATPTPITVSGLTSRPLRCTRCAARRRLSSTADRDVHVFLVRLVCRLASER
eukprot:scaffold83412_cov66-Phaeocystis_antarctica.AAC.3